MPRRPRTRRSSSRPAAGLRLIGGEWRGRRLAVAERPGLRPTPDRVRETLFNWLAPRIAGSRCLDLFAGTGALGLEALSRGAGHVTFVDTDRAATAAIEAALVTLGAGARGHAVTADAGAQAAAAGPFDIVFIDPPFDADLHAGAVAAIAPRLAPGARLYLEYPAARQAHIEALLADDFDLLRARRAGAVGYCLAQPGARSEDSRP